MNEKTSEEKKDLEWHRSFNNQNLSHTTTMVVVVTAWLAATVTLTGIIFWMLTKMI